MNDLKSALRLSTLTLLIGFGLWVTPTRLSAQVGHVLESVGPINQSMGGAGTALPLDSMTALQWNAAAISGLEHSEIGFAFSGLIPETYLSSSVAANSFGPSVPAFTMAGQSKSDIDPSPMPSFGFVSRNECSNWSYGLGGSAIAGFGVDYAASGFNPENMNPILTPQPGTGNGFGFGSVYSSFQMLQISPTVAYQLTERLSVGFAPTFNWTSLGVCPWPAITPNANGTYPSGAHADSRWGLGFHTGLFWQDCCSGWSFGLSYKSTQWIDNYKINSWDEMGFPREINFDMDYPAIISMGVGYTGIERWSFAADVRYIDYNNTDGFRRSGYDSNGAVVGFGWDSITVLSLGAQFQPHERLRIRMGYTVNENPIRDDVTFYNIVSPAIVMNHLSGGLSLDLCDRWTASIAYTYGFTNSITGPWQSGAGPMPGTSVTSELATHIGSFGISTKF